MIEPEGELQSPLAIRSRFWATSWWKSISVLGISLAAGLGSLTLIYLFARPLGMLFLAICIAAALTPLVEYLLKWLSRNAAIILIYTVLFFLAILVIALLIPPIITQVKDFSQRLPEILDRAYQLLDQNGISSEQVNTFISEGAQNTQNLASIPMAMISGVFDGLIVLVVSLYLLMDIPKIRRFILSLFGDQTREHIDSVGLEMTHMAGGYVRGVMIDMLFVSVITTIGLSLIGLPFALVLGIIAGLFEALPIVGTMIAAVPVLIIAILQSPTTALITLAFVLIMQLVQGNLISPNVMKGQAEVPQFIVPLAVLAGGVAGGVLGALIAVPLVAVLRVLVLRVVAPFIRRHTGAFDTPYWETT